MLQQPPDKSVVDALRSRTAFKPLDKSLVLHIIPFEKRRQIRVLHTLHIRKQLLVHLFHIIFAGGQIICRVILALSSPAHPLDGHLQRSRKAGHIAHHFYVIQDVEFIDPKGVRLPDLAIDRPCLVLQNHIFIRFAILGHGRLPEFTQINPRNSRSLMQFPDIFHNTSPLSLYISPAVTSISIST